MIPVFNLLIISSVIIYIVYTIFILTGLLKIRSKGNFIDLTKDVPLVSVVVAARNEEMNLPGLLSDLSKQDYPEEKLEIIIADDRSEDRTWAILQEFEGKFTNIVPVKIKDRSITMTPKKHALSTAISASSGTVILSTDADCRLPITWVSSMVASLQHTRKGITAGYSCISKDASGFNNRYQRLDFLVLMSANAGATGWGFAWSGSGQNLAYTRNDFNAVNGFKPVADWLSGDDVYLIQSIGKRSGIIYNGDPGGFVETMPVPTVTKFLSQRIRWASNARYLPGRDWFFLCFLFNVFILNAGLFIALILPGHWNILPAIFSLKFLADALVCFTGSEKFKTHVQPIDFIIWSVIQPIYIPFLGLSGLIGRFTWKQ
jgi:cellulose synthase/poly-beta-1,6-N-acetylglucosamine synthase-like glycosyltransferase